VKDRPWTVESDLNPSPEGNGNGGKGG